MPLAEKPRNTQLAKHLNCFVHAQPGISQPVDLELPSARGGSAGRPCGYQKKMHNSHFVFEPSPQLTVDISKAQNFAICSAPKGGSIPQTKSWVRPEFVHADDLAQIMMNFIVWK